MSTSSTGDSKPEEKTPTGDPKPESTHTLTKEEYESLQRRAENHDSVAAEARRAREALAAKEKEIEAAELEKAKAAGDLQKQLELATNRAKELEESNNKTQELLRNRVVKAEILEIAAKYSSNPKAVFALSQQHFTTQVEADGSVSAVLTGGGNIDSFISGFVDSELPESKLSSRQHGTGPGVKKEVTPAKEGSSYSNEELSNMSQAERRMALTKGGSALQKQYFERDIK